MTDKPTRLCETTGYEIPVRERKPIEGGWCIEHHTSSPAQPKYWCGYNDGGDDWSIDHLKAVRFSRKQDAQTVSEYLEQLEDSWHKNRVAYHEWG